MMDDMKPQKSGAKSPVTQTNIPKTGEPAFAPPEVVAAKEARFTPLKSASQQKPSILKKRLRINLTRKQWLIVSGVALLLIGGSVAGWYFFLKQKPLPPPVAVVEPPPEPPKPTTIASRMTGVQIAFELNDLPSTGVMIENSPDARPQAGLLQADLVFEAIAEGGITRFLALYQESKPDYIGPVRSVRPYYLDFLVPFDGAIAHAGGSGKALAQIKSQGIKDLDHGANGSTYQRVSNRYAPHNLYTSRQKLLDLQSKKGFTSKYTGFKRKTENKPTVGPSAKAIDLAISSANYKVHYDYDTANNIYKRTLGSKPHTDERSGTQLAPKVVIALVVPFSQDGIYSVYNLSAGGKAYFFQDGTITTGNWSKANRNSQFIFTDSAGAAFELNAGQTWVTLVKTADQVKATP